MTPFRSFAYRDFRFLWAGTLLWAAAVWMQRIAISWLVLELTDSPLLVALAYSLPQAPYVILGPFAGALADRVNRKLMLVGAQAVTCAGTAVLAVMVATGTDPAWLVMLIAVLLGMALSVNFVSVQTIIYDVVGPKDAMNGLSLWFVGIRGVGAVGALTGGEVIEQVGIWPAFAASSGVYVLAGGVFTLMRYRSRISVEPGASMMENLKTGLRYMLGSRELTSLVVLSTAAEAFGWGVVSLFAVFASDAVFDIGPRGLGIMTAAFAVGGVVGSAALASVRDVGRKGLVLTLAIVAAAVVLAGFSQSDWFALSVVLLAVFGLTLAAYDTLTILLIQEHAPEGMRGRAVGALQVTSGVGPVGPLTMGALAGGIGVQTAVGIGAGVLLAAVGVVSAVVPKVRAMR
ncbi:MAG: MFS transporter [SAR202 cluster bacterium]|nr:MFS transporter [SAR202 cluster bacterium]